MKKRWALLGGCIVGVVGTLLVAFIAICVFAVVWGNKQDWLPEYADSTVVRDAAAIVGCRLTLAAAHSVPDDIAGARLLSYSYTKSGTTRLPMHFERVERCEGDPTRCLVSLFDLSRATDANVDAHGEPVPDTLTVGADVLERIKQMIIEAEAWRFKESYRPRMEIMDGWSWGFSASFERTASAASRRHGRILSSGGSNAAPQTELFNQVREYLEKIFEDEKLGER